MPSTTPDFSTVTAGVSSVRAGAPSVSLIVEGSAAAAARAAARRRRAVAVLFSARRRRTMRAAARRAPAAARRAGWAQIRRQQIRRQRFAGARLRPFALFPRRRGKQQIALRLHGGRGVGWRSLRRRRARGALILPGRWWWRRNCAGPVPADSRRPACRGSTGNRSRRRAGGDARWQYRPHFAARLRHAGAKPPGDFFSSRTAIQSPSMIAPVQTPITPARISVLPSAEFVDRYSVADRQQARQNKAKTGNQHANHHRTDPPACARNARRPPTPRYCHNVRIANGNSARISSTISSRGADFREPIHPGFSPARISTSYQLWAICCVASGN